MLKHLLTIGIFSLLSVSSFAQRADQIIDSYLEAIGGKEALRTLIGVKTTAEYDVQGAKVPHITYEMSDGMGLTLFQNADGTWDKRLAFDGTDLWEINSSSGRPRKNSVEETENRKRLIGENPTPFLDYQEKGYTVEMMDVVVLSGVDYYKIKLTTKPSLVNGEEVVNIQYYYFDQETYFPIQRDSEIMSGELKGKNMVIKYSDYEEVDGFYFAHKNIISVNGYNQVCTVSAIELDPDVQDDFFSFPSK